MPRPAGFTLWELLVTLVVAAVLVGLAAPAFEQIALDSRRTATVNAFVTAVQLARSESAKRGRPVVLCATADRLACGDGADYGAGWMVFVDLDEARPVGRAPEEPLLWAYAPAGPGPIHSNRARYVFRPVRRRSTNGTITFCDERGARQARAVIISYTARPRVSERGPGDRRLVCEDLP